MFRNEGIGSWPARRARISPDRIALVHGDERWTYADLAARATRLARALAHLGVDRGERVAVLARNEPCHLEALFACGLLGAVFVPLHPGIDDDARAAIVRDAGCAIVIHTPALTDAARRLRERVRVRAWLDATDPAIARESDEPIDRPVALGDVCLLGYTSGTTGASKGVVLTHGNIAFNVLNVMSAVDYLHDDVMVASAPLYRLGGLGFLLPVLFKGGTCVIPRSGDAEELLGLVERHRATILFDGPRALEAIAESPAFARTDLSSVRACLCGGATIPEQLGALFAARGVPFRRGYGLTEAAPVVLLEAEGAEHAGDEGRPPMLSAVRVVDDAFADVPPGEVGELVVHGPNVMRGYWERPDDTARAITADGWLRTGDAASLSTAGTVAIVGRVADAIAIDGRRIHPRWIESAVMRVEGVADCAVAQPSRSSPLRVFVVPRAGASVSRADVLHACKALLPPRWRPTEVAFVDRLPRNANGKLLRRELA